MPIAAGAKLPADVTGFVMENEKPTAKTLGDLTAGKTVVMFGVPGAFTPTCDQQHLPSYVQELANLHAKGVDQVICLSMNDIFVLQEWNKVSGAASILMLSDGNGEITNALDLALDGTGFGLGAGLSLLDTCFPLDVAFRFGSSTVLHLLNAGLPLPVCPGPLVLRCCDAPPRRRVYQYQLTPLPAQVQGQHRAVSLQCPVSDFLNDDGPVLPVHQYVAAKSGPVAPSRPGFVEPPVLRDM